MCTARCLGAPCSHTAPVSVPFKPPSQPLQEDKAMVERLAYGQLPAE